MWALHGQSRSRMRRCRAAVASGTGAMVLLRDLDENFVPITSLKHAMQGRVKQCWALELRSDGFDGRPEMHWWTRRSRRLLFGDKSFL